LFENGVTLRMGRELRDDFDTPAVIEVGTVKPPQAELSVARALQEQSPDMRLFRVSADHPDAVVKVGFGLRNRLPVDEPNQRPQQQVDENDKLVASAACSECPTPASIPTAAEHHKVAAVLRPVT
jgi:hypothetical protein